MLMYFHIHIFLDVMVLSENALKFFNSDELISILDEHYEGKYDNSRKIWTIYIFLVWYEIYFGEIKN